MSEHVPLAELRDELKSRMGEPGRWELLFENPSTLIRGAAERLECQSDPIKNPCLEQGNSPIGPISKPASTYIGGTSEWPSFPALGDKLVREAFEAIGRIDLLPHFYLAGEPAAFRLNPVTARAGILVAGGNAAGLNMVVDSIMKRLTGLASMIKDDKTFRPHVLGYEGGYPGLLNRRRFSGVRGEILTIEDTDPRAGDPCIFLKTLRGSNYSDEELDSAQAKEELDALAGSVVHDKLNLLFVIGGNGTFKWANKLYQLLRARRHPIALICGPKTMDLDLSFVEATFGFRTAVDHAVEFIRTIHWEAEALDRIAVIELFGAASGFVALHAGFLSGVADCILIPEIPFSQEALFERIEQRLAKNKHAVVVVAEGALLQFEHGYAEAKEDAYAAFVNSVKAQFKGRHGIVDVRPRYLIRGTPPNSFDLDLAKYSGYLMADAALAGFTNCAVQLWQGQYVLVPLETAISRHGQVQTYSTYFWYMAQKYLLPR